MTAVDGTTASPRLTGPGLHGVVPGIVVDVADPAGRGRVLVRMPWAVDEDEGYEAWARLATLMGGAGRGSWFVPEVDDEVLLAFEGGDPRRPYVLGGLWNGVDDPPEQMDDGGRNDIRSFTSRNGLKLTFDDSDGSERIELVTPAGNRVVLDDGGRSITVEDPAGSSIALDAGGVTIRTSTTVAVEASTVDVSASMVTVNAGMSRFSGVVQADTVITNSVISSSYTPGAGNIW